MKIVNIFFTILAACLLGLSSGAFASPLQIFVSIPPQKWLVEQVGGKLVSTHVLVDRGQEPHNFEPTPKQVAALFRSQLFFTVDMAKRCNIKTIAGMARSHMARSNNHQ